MPWRELLKVSGIVKREERFLREVIADPVNAIDKKHVEMYIKDTQLPWETRARLIEEWMIRDYHDHPLKYPHFTTAARITIFVKVRMEEYRNYLREKNE